ncbi:sorting nexin-19a isoform X3 [Denticeps clupeoides]|uniref:sorting nexin-19a isoform X3 n=1 Tax=Denticeps clupeoides TaxID=299321 RepID=UPI0010A2B5DF|nr:sorting nexin-19-like isoform X3 [Denticeps clupeoides]
MELNGRTLQAFLGQWKVLGLAVFLAWLVLFHLLVSAWTLCLFTSVLVVLGSWLGCRVALDANSLLHLEHFVPTWAPPPGQHAADSERWLDWEIHSIVSKAVRDFVSSWYSNLVSKDGEEESEFEEVVREAMLAAAEELKRRAKKVDRRTLAQRVLELCGSHLQSYGCAREQMQLLTKPGCDRKDLWRLYSQADTPHPALASPAAELCYSRALVDLLLQVLVPYPHMETRTGGYMVGELITCNVLLPLVARISNPDWLNHTVVDVFMSSFPMAGTQAEVQVGRTATRREAQQEPSVSDVSSLMHSDHQETSSTPTESSTSLHSLSFSEEFLLDSGNEQFFSDGRKSLSNNSSAPDSYVTSDSTCDCLPSSDFCGLAFLEEESFGLLGSVKRPPPKVLISGQTSWSDSPVEETCLLLSQGGCPEAPGEMSPSPFSLDPLRSPEGPVVIQNLHIAGTVVAKEQRGSGTHQYTLYTIKYETTGDPECSSQPVAYHMVNRRYSEFINLQARLEEKSDLRKVVKNVKGPKKFFPDLPFGNAEIDKVETRKGYLETYIKQLCSIPETANSEEIQEFLALSTDATMTFEKKQSVPRIDKLVVNAIVDTLKTAFPRPEPQSPTEEVDTDLDGRAQSDSKKIRSRLRFSSKIAPALNVSDLQPRVSYCFSEGSSLLRGLEAFVQEQERLLCGDQWKGSEDGRVPALDQREEEMNLRASDTRPLETVSDIALADVALNVLCLLMKEQWSWLCTENVQKIIRLLFGTCIERWLNMCIARVTSAPCWVIYLRVLQEAVWPGGEPAVVSPPERSPEERRETCQQCLQCLTQLLPEIIPDILGLEKYRLSWEHVLASLQDSSINRHLLYCIFDLLLEFLIPESSDVAFQRSLLPSLSGDVDRAAASPWQPAAPGL